MSQREFDRARTNLDKWAAVPSARQICARLNVSWRPLLAALFEPDRDVDKFVSHKQRTAVAHGLDDGQIAATLRIVATRLGVTTLRPAQYDAERAELRSENQRRYRHGAALTLATANQIIRAAGDWDRALAVAGLDERPALTGSQPSEVSYHEAVRRFLESQGAMPTSTQLERLAAAQRFPLPRIPAGGHKQALLEVQAAFAAEGRWAPATYPPKNRRPVYDFEGPSAADRPEGRRVKRYSKEDCLAGVLAYLVESGPGERASQKRYGAWAVGTPHPAPSALGRHGGWTALLAEARARRLSAGR